MWVFTGKNSVGSTTLSVYNVSLKYISESKSHFYKLVLWI